MKDINASATPKKKNRIGWLQVKTHFNTVKLQYTNIDRAIVRIIGGKGKKEEIWPLKAFFIVPMIPKDLYT